MSVFFFSAPYMNLKCSRIKDPSKELGITFVWPEIPVNSSANFTCPKNPAIKVPRMCTAGGKWGGYDKNGCGMLSNNFTNLVTESENVFTL